MRTKSNAVTFLEALGVYFKEYSRKRKSHLLCVVHPTPALIHALLTTYRVITRDEAACYRLFLEGKIPFAIVVPLQFASYAKLLVQKLAPHRGTIFLWHRGRVLQHDR